MWSRWSESCRFDIVFDFTLNLWCEAQGCLFVCFLELYYAPKLFTLSSSASSRTEGASQEISRAAQRKTNAVTVFVRFEKTIKILFERQNIFLLCMVCMVFGIISRTKARSATNEIPKCRSPERALLRHSIIGVRLLTSARRAKLPK